MSATKLHNFGLAVATLKRFVAQATPGEELSRAGVIQAYEFSFELAWKVFQHIATEQGLAANFPKQAIKAAFQMGLVDNDDLWVDMLRDRNLTVHTYNPALATDIYGRICAHYLAEFERVEAAARAFSA